MKDIKRLSCIVVLQVCDFGYLLFIITVPMVILLLGAVTSIMVGDLLVSCLCVVGIVYCSVSALLVQYGLLEGIIAIAHPETVEEEAISE